MTLLSGREILSRSEGRKKTAIAKRKAVFLFKSARGVEVDDGIRAIRRREGEMSTTGLVIETGGAVFREYLNSVFKSAESLTFSCSMWKSDTALRNTCMVLMLYPAFRASPRKLVNSVDENRFTSTSFHLHHSINKYCAGLYGVFGPVCAVTAFESVLTIC